MPRGKIPREEVGITNSHFTLAPFNDFNGDLRCLTIIFAGEKLHPGWALGPCNSDDEEGEGESDGDEDGDEDGEGEGEWSDGEGEDGDQ